jgi:signal transduction histidine kinase
MPTPPADILVVDDELGIREGCRRILTREGHRVEQASSGEEAWERVCTRPFDLVLIDVMMPGISGLDLMRRIVAYQPDLVCVIITGYATIELAVEAMKSGAYTFIAKPFEADLLLLTVQQGLERRRMMLEAKRIEKLEAEKQALERRNAELEREALERSNRELAELARMKSAFALTVAHELRAPTAATQSYLRLMLDGYIPPEDYQEYLRRAEQRTVAQLELINDLLDLARLQNPDIQIERERVNLGESLNEVCAMMRGQAKEKRVTFIANVPSPMPVISADPNHLRQLWCNLVSNAIKYTNEGGAVAVTAKVQDQQLIVRVQDTGIGIAQDEMTRIFEEFYRTKAAKQCAESGTGLGLSIAKRIAETYAGRIDVESTVGKGSTFTVTLPVGPLSPEIEGPGSPAT